MERKKLMRHNHPERKNSIPIWPGVLVITICACLLFLVVNYLGYKAGLLTLPRFMESVLSIQQKENENTGTGDVLQNLQSGLDVVETEYSYYHPENTDPLELLLSLHTAESFHQRMRFTAVDEKGVSRSWVTNLYAADDCWRIEQDNSLVISNGDNLWRGNVAGRAYVTELGDFTWNNHLAIPNLAELQEYGKQYPENISFRETERTIYIEYQPSEMSRVLCHIAIDTGLVTELQIYVNEKQVLFMYTERISVSPDICNDLSLFAWPDNNLNG